MAKRAGEFLSDAERDRLLDRYDRDQERLRNYRTGQGGFDDVGSATAGRQAQALEDHYNTDGYGGHDWYDKLRRERDEDRGLGNRSDAAPDFTAPADYSGAKDYSSPGDKTKGVADSLRNGEQGKNGIASGRDIGQQEGAGWNNKAGSDLGNAVKNADSQQGGFFSRHKKGVIGWVIALAMGGGMFGATTLLSGPAQWIQVMNFIKDMTSWVSGAQTGARYLYNMRTLAQWEDKISDTIQNSRLGIVGKRVANRAIARMQEQGMTFNSNVAGNAHSVTLDTTAQGGNGLSFDEYNKNKPLREYGFDSYDKDIKDLGDKYDNKTITYEEYNKQMDKLREKFDTSSDKYRKDMDNYFKNNQAEKTRIWDTIEKKYGNANILDVDFASGRITFDFDKLSYSEARRFINATNNVGKYDLMGKIQTRMALKKVGKISWLHPIKKLEQKAINKFADWLTDRIKKRALDGFSNIDEALEAVAKSTREVAEKAEGATKESVEEAVKKAVEEARGKFTKAIESVGKDATEKIVKYVIEKTGAKVSASTVTKAIPIVGWIMLAIQVECMVIALGDGIGAEKYGSTVTAAEGDTAETLAIGSQVMSGYSQDQDIDMDQLGMYTQLKLYNPDVSEVTAEAGDDGKQVGEKTVGTTSSSWWNAPAVKASLGEKYTESERNNVPAPLDDVANANLSFGGNKLGGQIWSAFSGGVKDAMEGNGAFAAFNPLAGGYNFLARSVGLPTTSQMLCAVMDGLDWLLGQIVTILWKSSIFGMLNDYFGISDAIAQTEPAKAMMAWAGNMYMSAMGWLRGNPLNLDTATPEQYGSINMYGGRFSSNEQMLAVGGVAQPKEEEQLLMLEQKQYLAEQQAQKPLLARLFDPSDYNSTIAQIGRATGIDTSDQSIETQLKNVGKIFASVPKLFSFALGKMGGNAYAADSPYDYGVPLVAFSRAEMAKLVGGDSSYDIIPNTEKVFSMIDAGELDSNKVKKCFGAEIGDKSTGYKVTQLDNQEGKAWNYADSLDDAVGEDGEPIYSFGGGGGYNSYKIDCMNSDLLRARAYMLDYETMVSADCYENDGWSGGDSADSCSEMGFDVNGVSSDNGNYDSDDNGDPGDDYDYPATNGECPTGDSRIANYGTQEGRTGANKSKSINTCGILNAPAKFKNSQGKYVIEVNANIAKQTADMFEAAQKSGINMKSTALSIGFRSYEMQKCIYDYYRTGNRGCSMFQTRPTAAANPDTRASNHQMGFAIDIPCSSSANNRLNSWLNANMKKYGFNRPMPTSDCGHIENKRS